MHISENLIRQCSLTLGQFDRDRTNSLVTLFHHQNACSQLTRLLNNLKEKFENLLSIKRDDDDDVSNDTPLTRIELSTMIQFKMTYLIESLERDERKLARKFSVEDELNLAYCFLLAQIDDRLNEQHLQDLKLLFAIEQSIQNLYNLFEKLGGNFPRFFSLLLQAKYFEKKVVMVDQLIRDFQPFIQRYEDFLVTFEKQYQPPTGAENHDTQTDALANPNDTSIILPLIPILGIREQIQATVTATAIAASPNKQPAKAPLPSQPILPTTVASSSDNIPRKALCVIINIKSFYSSKSVDTPKRAGSDKDVGLIRFVFNKLKFTVLECRYDFKKKNLNDAFNHIDDKDQFGDFDCLVMFIMSHGLLHSLFTADSEEVVIRDIVRRYADSSSQTIWKGKPRLFFIQACRSTWPDDIPPSYREGVKINDLSPEMLVAYSCSASEASKRSPTAGSIFIQILCVMILRYGHIYSIQHILDFTAKFVIKRDEFCSECRRVPINIQRPEYVERSFSSKFRFGDTCLINNYQSWIYDEQSILHIPLTIWHDIYNLIYQRPNP